MRINNTKTTTITDKTIICNTNNNFSIGISGKHVIYKGESIIIPHRVLRGSNTQCIINNKIYINGYEFIESTKTFKKTFRAWLECYIFSLF